MTERRPLPHSLDAERSLKDLIDRLVARQREGRLLPFSTEGERILLGSAMRDNDIIDEVRDIVAAADFYEPANVEIWRLCLDFRDHDRAIVPETLLPDMTQNYMVGYGLTAAEYLRMLVEEGVDSAKIAVEAARGIADNALARRCVMGGLGFVDDIYERPPSMGAAYIRDKYDTTFGKFFPSLASLEIRHLADYGQSVIERVEELTRTDSEGGLPIGLSMVQDLTGPLMRGRLYTIGAESGSGKSVVGQQILEYICRKDTGKVGLLIQAEMEGEENATRALAAATSVRGESIERGMVSDEEYAALVEANVRLRDVSVYVDATSAPTASRIRARAAKMKRKEGLDLLMIDDIMHVAPPEPRMNYLDAIPPNLQAMKDMAKDFHIPVVVLTPLKSTYHDGNIRRPRIGDLPFPAAFNQKSDVILFIHRPEYILGRNEPSKDDKDRAAWEVSMEQWKGRAEALLAKRRGGVDHGVRQLYFDPQRVRFSDNAPRGPSDGLPF